MKVGYKTLASDPTGSGSDLGDIFIPKNLFTQGGLWVWGLNNSGQLATNNLTNYSSPVQTISGGTNWKQITSIGIGMSGIKTDGTLWSWGYNGYGNLGTNNTTNYSSPVQTVSAGTNWKLVAGAARASSGGLEHTAAIKTDGTLWLWGSNGQGQLGVGDRTNRSSPVQTVAGGTNWKLVSCGLYYNAAIKTDGTLWTWGYNLHGNLGTNDTTYYSSPVQTISGGTNWKQVSCGYLHTAAIKTDGTLWTWGYNFTGQLGNNASGSNTQKSSPVQTITGGTNWKSVSGGYSTTAAIKTDGTLWTWGDNTYGHLGDNTTTIKSSPVQTISGGTNWKQISMRGQYMAAIKTDGTLWTWGRNDYGNLGTNNVTSYSSPVQTVSGGTNWKEVNSSHDYHMSAIREDYY